MPKKSSVLKTLLKLFIGVPVLVVLIVVVFIATIDPTRLAPLIQSQLANQGIDASIDGKISWQFYPELGLKVEDITLRSLNTQAAASTATPLATIKQVSFGVDVKPLLQRKILINSLLLQQTSIHLLTNQQGQSNWVLPESHESSAEKPLLNQEDEKALPEIDIQSLRIENLQLNFLDQRASENNSKTEMSVNNFNFDSTSVNLRGTPFPAKLGFTLTTNSLPTLNLNASLSPAVMLEKNSYKVNDLDMQLSLSKAPNSVETVHVQGSVDAITSELLTQINANLHLNKIDVDNILSMLNANEEPLDKASNTEAEPLPLEAIRSLTSHLKINVDEVIANKIVANNLDLEVKSEKGLVTVDHLKANTLGGKINTKATFDGRKNKATLKFDGTAEQIDIGKLLKDMLDNDNLAGKSTLNFSGSSTGISTDQLINNLHASADARSQGMVLQPINIEKQYCKFIALLDKNSNAAKLINTREWQHLTQLEPVELSIQYAENQLEMKNFGAKITALNATANGTFNIETGKFNFPISLSLVSDASGPDACFNIDEKWRKYALPLRCKGNLDSLGIDTCLPDTDLIASILKTNAKAKIDTRVEEEKAKVNQRLDEEKEKAKEKAKKKLENKLDKLLNDL